MFIKQGNRDDEIHPHSSAFHRPTAWSAAAVAGEINGSQTNPKSQFSQGASWCKFSGLNDNPDDPADGPPGRVQNYGHEMLYGLHDPTTGDTPGQADFGCNPTKTPITPDTPPQ